MKTTSDNGFIKATARKQLLGNYRTAVFAYLIASAIITTLSGIFRMQLSAGRLLQLFIYCIVEVIILLLSSIFLAGQNYLYLNIARGRDYSYRDVWFGFVRHADRVIRIELFMMLHMIIRGLPFFISAMLLLALRSDFWVAATVIFGLQFLINAVSLQLTYFPALFLILDDENADMRMIVEGSILLMNGNRLRLFKLILSFIGLYILSLITFGLGFLWVGPYYYSSRANFYLDLLRRRRTMKIRNNGTL